MTEAVGDLVASADRRPRRRPSALIVAAVGLAVVAIPSFVLWARAAGSPTSAPALTAGTPVRVDRPAPLLSSVPLLAGGRTRIGPYDGVVTVVNFWASWCGPCRRESGMLANLSNAYRGRRVRFFGVDEADRRAAALAFAQGHPVDYPSVLDPNGTVGDAFTIVGLPTTLIVTPEGRVRYVVFGAIRAGPFRTALDRVLREAFAGPSP
jgi:thiol-disulfide isomerase/thioredoxin